MVTLNQMKKFLELLNQAILKSLLRSQVKKLPKNFLKINITLGIVESIYLKPHKYLKN